MKLGPGSTIVSMSVIKDSEKDGVILVVGSNGTGKKTKISEFKIQGRGGSGIKAMKVTDKTGTVIGIAVIHSDNTELIAMSAKSQVIRTSLDSIPTSGRDTQGVSIMRLKTGDSVVRFVRV